MNSLKTVGFPINDKENEKRRSLLPTDLKRIKHTGMIYIEEGYGEVLGIPDEAYVKSGAQVASRKEILDKDIICDAKIGDAAYLAELREGQIIFGWVHAVQNREITDAIVDNKLTAYAWEDMFELTRHLFWRNNQMAGEAAVMHAYLCYGRMPYETKVAVLGKGNVAQGAIKILTKLGADVTIYDIQDEALFKKDFKQYDVVVNAVLWDTKRKDHIIYERDLPEMKRGSMIVDISCDRRGGIESSVPTTIEEPYFFKGGVMHYAVDHTPSLFYKTTSACISVIVSRYIDELITDEPDDILKKALIIEEGAILDQRIKDFQNRC